MIDFAALRQSIAASKAAGRLLPATQAMIADLAEGDADARADLAELLAFHAFKKPGPQDSILDDQAAAVIRRRELRAQGKSKAEVRAILLVEFPMLENLNPVMDRVSGRITKAIKNHVESLAVLVSDSES